MLSGTSTPADTGRRFLGCKRHLKRRGLLSRICRSTGHQVARAPRPASRVNKRRQVSWLADPSLAGAFPGLTPVANHGMLSAYSCGGSCGIRALTRHRIPFSLLIFEETVISATLKGSRLGLVNGVGIQADLACGGESPVYSSDRRRFPQQSAGRKTGTR